MEADIIIIGVNCTDIDSKRDNSKRGSLAVLAQADKMSEDFTRCEEEIVKRLPKNIARIAKIPPTDKKEKRISRRRELT